MPTRTSRVYALAAFVSLLLVSFSSAFLPNAGAAPAAGGLVIPRAQQAVTLDGNCSEYGDALVESYADASNSTGKVYLKHDGEQLYVCVAAAPGKLDNRFESVYLDPQGDGSNYQFAQKDDYSLRVAIPSSNRSTLSGSGVANGYTPAPAFDAVWNGKASVTPNGESIEYSISLGRFRLGECGALFGLAAYHHWISAVGDDYGWPSNQFFDQPRTWKLVQLADAPCANPLNGKIAYVYRGNAADAASFFNFLTSRGYGVTLVPTGSIMTTDFSTFDLILVADDSGSLNTWQTAAQAQHIRDGNKPIIGLGEGGYAFFGQLSQFIGWPNGWHGPQKSVVRAPGDTTTVFTAPTAVPSPVDIYTQPVNEVGIYLNGAGGVPADVVPVGLEPPTSPTGAPSNHASLILQSCFFLWGFSGNPTLMTGNGQNLFVNTVEYMLHFQCPRTPPPPDQCVSIKKSAEPPDGTPVAPGQVIKYTITYSFSDNPDCKPYQREAKLIDSIPADTIYVPGSASDGIIPTADGALIWGVGPAGGSKTFKVWVSDTQCHNQRRVVNRAGLLIPGYPPIISNIVTHPVTCPPVSFPNDEPPYAESEVQITPYPLITGTPSEISVRVSNNSGTAQTITVEFQTSPNRFGIGLDFNTFSSKVVTIPAHSSAIVKTTFTPVSSGHYCIQIKVQGGGFAPIYTQRNLDVTEDLKPGQADNLVFKVRNNSNVTTDIALVVDNTCPGWSAVVSPAVLPGMAPGEVRDATLTVTPPNPVVLGSACHIDVQGWIGDQLIGGIRKLDVPPVHLPHDVQPSWLEPEISTVPSPPVLGQTNQICVELQNPLPFPRTVTLEYAVADFGAGIPFTTVATKSFTLPPNSNAKYCADWTPTPSNNLHRCILVTLKQDGYQDQRSQRNVDLRRPLPLDIGKLDVTFTVGNPDLVAHTLVLSPTIYGIDPYWKPVFVTDPGDPPPNVLQPGQILNLHLRMTPAILIGLSDKDRGDRSHAAPEAQPADTTPPVNYRYGDESRVDVSVLLDGQEVGGVSAQFDTSTVSLPLIIR